MNFIIYLRKFQKRNLKKFRGSGRLGLTVNFLYRFGEIINLVERAPEA